MGFYAVGCGELTGADGELGFVGVEAFGEVGCGDDFIVEICGEDVVHNLISF